MLATGRSHILASCTEGKEAENVGEEARRHADRRGYLYGHNHGIYHHRAVAQLGALQSVHVRVCMPYDGVAMVCRFSFSFGLSLFRMAIHSCRGHRSTGGHVRDLIIIPLELIVLTNMYHERTCRTCVLARVVLLPQKAWWWGHLFPTW